jgi:hypothetical protein
MNETTKLVIGVVIAGLLIGGAIMFNKKEKMVTVPIEGNISDTYKDNFMEGCISDTSTYADCNCYYNSLERQIGKENMLQFSLDYIETEQIPEKVLTRVIEDCLE